MKKLNRKGFTLVELLAVIIILAIVVGITIPAVLTTTEKAKVKAFQTAADTAADWFDRQYQVATTGLGATEIATLDSNFEIACGSDGTLCESGRKVQQTNEKGELVSDSDGNPVMKTLNSYTFSNTDNKALLSAAGLKTSNVEEMTVMINSETGRTCVILKAALKGDYTGAGYTSATVSSLNTITKSGDIGTGEYMYSSNCTVS